MFASALVPLARCWRGIITPRYCKAAHNCYQMASPDRMEVDDNSSDGESSGEENPEAMSDKKAWLAWARALTWDASVADDRDCFSVDALPDDDDRRNTAELIADLQTLRQLSETPVADGFRFPEGLGLLKRARRWTSATTTWINSAATS